jgi:large subunit ribosomal protein L22
VKGKPLAQALAMLRFMPQRAATPILKAVRSAAANAENNLDLDPNDLVVVRVVADEGRTLRRFRPKARGRVGSIQKRSTHITVVVQEKGS